MSRTIAISQVQREWYRRLSGSDANLVVVPNGVTDPGPVDLERGGGGGPRWISGRTTCWR